MKKVTLKNVLLIIQRTINSLDNRLLNHGEQVGYICLRMARMLGYSEEQLRTLCTLAAIHDIGAYKVEERKQLVEFEVGSPHEHAVYGSLFVRHFGPLQDGDGVILYHHWRYENRHKAINDRIAPDDCFLLNLADRISVLFAHNLTNLKEAIRRLIPQTAGSLFKPEHVRLLLQMMETTDLIDKLLDGSYLDEFYGFMDQFELGSEEVMSYLSMLVYAIEFRSRATVTHSISVVSCAQQIAKLAELSVQDYQALSKAALLHDIGKITTPIEILTKPGKLTPSEMEQMRSHVCSTRKILKGTGLEKIRNLASNHHEKPNGNGYPDGLKGDDLCFSSRILAVADILTALVEPRYYKPAFPKEEVLDILNKASANLDIDPQINAIVQNNYDAIVGEMLKAQQNILDLYEQITAENEELLRQMYRATSTPAEILEDNRIAA